MLYTMYDELKPTLENHEKVPQDIKLHSNLGKKRNIYDMDTEPSNPYLSTYMRQGAHGRASKVNNTTPLIVKISSVMGGIIYMGVVEERKLARSYSPRSQKM